MARRRIGFWSNASLTSKFLLIAVPLTVLVTVTTFALLETNRTRTAMAELDQRIAQLASIQAAALSGPVWSFNQTQIDLILDAIVNDPDLVGILVRDDLAAPLGQSGITSDQGALSQGAVIYRVQDQGPAMVLGTVRLFYTRDRLAQESLQQVRTAAVVTALLTLALVVSALVALQYAVRLPLRQFGRAIDAARETNRHVAVDVTTGDEFGNLASAYNTLQKQQKSDKEQLRRIQDNLETLVGERTRELKAAIDALTTREGEILRARDDAREALTRLRRTQDRLVQSEKMASLGQLTAGIAHEIKNPLNFINNFSVLSQELLAELAQILRAADGSIDHRQACDAIDLIETVTGNLARVQDHGRRADSIVRTMLLHSRSGPSSLQNSGLNAILNEALKLSFHSSRAELEGFNIDMVTDYAPDLPPIQCHAQDLSRVFINVISNSMYATHQRSQSSQAEQPGYAPLIKLSTRLTKDGQAEARIEDNGNGIPPEAAEKIFTPFYTTKPAGEGTGLGLSISYDIVVNRHGGDIRVEHPQDGGARFVITLPLTQPEGAAQDAPRRMALQGSAP
ncbi:sensor histidine kinase [Tropicibacter oceani]|uniref:histidine kinase n=1 Tax=Tropicibacter oceani TaxID=3058420 RepID=A0ABY8QP07_9RHOB|nr:ATP-binding protein [Tropicibacter oceani]WGW05688.1 ATP-binding protein [Tropicibacter oceani]